MGHYDDRYAYDDYITMTDDEKKSYFKIYDAEMKHKGEASGYYDDVHGYIITEWAEKRNYSTHRHHGFIKVKAEPLFVAATNAVEGEKK